MMSQEDMFECIQMGIMTLAEFQSWCSDLRAAAVEDADYAASAYGA